MKPNQAVCTLCRGKGKYPCVESLFLNKERYDTCHECDGHGFIEGRLGDKDE